jgi:hypothetical protein
VGLPDTQSILKVEVELSLLCSLNLDDSSVNKPMAHNRCDHAQLFTLTGLVKCIKTYLRGINRALFRFCTSLIPMGPRTESEFREPTGAASVNVPHWPLSVNNIFMLMCGGSRENGGGVDQTPILSCKLRVQNFQFEIPSRAYISRGEAEMEKRGEKISENRNMGMGE